MGNAVTKADLSPAGARLVELMQGINFGRITFYVRDGGPDFGRTYHTLRTVKLAGGENGPRPESGRADFELCKEQTALLDQLLDFPNGTRVNVEVKHGLPFLIEIEETVLA